MLVSSVAGVKDPLRGQKLTSHGTKIHLFADNRRLQNLARDFQIEWIRANNSPSQQAICTLFSTILATKTLDVIQYRMQ